MEKIKANVIIEIAGAPREHIEGTLKKINDMIQANKNYILLSSERSEIHEQEFPGKDEKKIKIFSAFTELEIEFKDFYALTGFCFEYMPSSLEILDPLNLKITAKELNESLNDLLAKLHHQSKIIMEYSALKKRIEKIRSNKQ